MPVTVALVQSFLRLTTGEELERVIAYRSHLLSKAEQCYRVTRQELLALVVFTRHFLPYLLGHHFVVRTDHSSLTWLRNFKNREGQLAH